METRGSSIKVLCTFLRANLNQLLTFQTDGNPFLIGRPVDIDCCDVVTVVEAAGYLTYIPLEEIIEIHTVIS